MLTDQDVLDSPPWWFDSPAWSTESPPSWLDDEDKEAWIQAQNLD
jgi:hypothetical protein